MALVSGYGADLFEQNARWTTRITRRKVTAELAIFAYPVLAELILHSDRARLFIVDESLLSAHVFQKRFERLERFAHCPLTAEIIFSISFLCFPR